MVPFGQYYRVAYRRLWAAGGRGQAAKIVLIAVLSLCFEGLFFGWLLWPSHYPTGITDTWLIAVNITVISGVAISELLRLVNMVSLSLASMAARDPIPVTPDPNLKVAFLTTIVPSKEPLEIVRETLQAAKKIRYAGKLDVWLLDEGNDPAVIAMCQELGVRHFSRKDVPRYNQPNGGFKRKTKHGNYNSWVDAHGSEYHIMLSVDPDHIPLPNFAERIMGYFRDPDVAYVVGPQCYRNSEDFVTRAAESQQFPFHSVIQRGANRYHAAMLVGTNNAIRISALRGIGGLADSITEDMATGLAFHTRRNPQTNKRWKSVYTPDVLATGEGPSRWGDYFNQQMRWSRGTFEILTKIFWKRAWRLSPGQLFHYGLITSFYPWMALGFLLGVLNSVLYLTVGATGIVLSPQIWLALYVDGVAFQLWLYVSNRRYNVSPYEAEGSNGLKGMVMSVIASPVYAATLIHTLLGRPTRFAVTPKGEARSRDKLFTFRHHLFWAIVLIGALITAFVLGYANIAVCVWPMITVTACLIPVAFSYARQSPGLASASGLTKAPEQQINVPYRAIPLDNHDQTMLLPRDAAAMSVPAAMSPAPSAAPTRLAEPAQIAEPEEATVVVGMVPDADATIVFPAIPRPRLATDETQILPAWPPERVPVQGDDW